VGIGDSNVVGPGEGETVWPGGLGVVFKVTGEEASGAFAVVEHPIETILPAVRKSLASRAQRRDKPAYTRPRGSPTWANGR